MRYRFQDFVLDSERFELLKQGEPVHAEPQVIELLLLLLENNGRMVSKEEIYNTIWAGKVVSEAALSSRIKSVRQILGDNGRQQTMVKTIHGKGFRFVMCVDIDTADSTADASQVAPYTPSHNSGRRPAIAVLPFANLSNHSEQEYFSDGITADIIAQLSKHRWLDVIARNTTYGYRGKAVDIRELGSALSVTYVVEGSVRKAGNTMRVSVSLIDANSGHQKWSDRYDRQLEDIFSLQDEITEMIAARLEPEIGFAERNKVVHSRPANLQAWDCYHLGIYHFYQFTGPDNLEAQRLLLQSQQLDNQFGEAYAWWAYAVILGMVYWDTTPSQALLDKTLSACDSALQLDRQNATFYALRARVLLARREYQNAISENKLAIELNPSFAAAHCGLGDSLAYEGQYEEALTCFEKAIALSPNDPQLWAFLTYGALVHLFKGDYETALEWSNRASRIPNCQYWARSHRAVALAHLNRISEAKAELAMLKQELPNFSLAFVREKLFYLKRPEQIDGYLEGLERSGLL